ncbi:hypothetical protein NDU88_001167 [Pleurodeles waltl]|uniref:Uncharacterized protein n=1 Tax=Pleurodeles waltl TaxID=8319 RepID=A0AAV7S9E5_PLEWA|nr:hypothetical protein NDU88_001167 [Pleurodeles waltl]
MFCVTYVLGRKALRYTVHPSVNEHSNPITNGARTSRRYFQTEACLQFGLLYAPSEGGAAITSCFVMSHWGRTPRHTALLERKAREGGREHEQGLSCRGGGVPVEL